MIIQGPGQEGATRMSTSIKVIPVAAALAVITVSTPAVAASGATHSALESGTTVRSSDTTSLGSIATNSETLDIRIPTRGGEEACVARHIDIGRIGTNLSSYFWRQFVTVHHPDPFGDDTIYGSSRPIDLATGKGYYWKDCIGAVSVGSTYYHDTYLRNPWGGYARLPRSTFFSSSPGTFSITYGSELIPQ